MSRENIIAIAMSLDKLMVGREGSFALAVGYEN